MIVLSFSFQGFASASKKLPLKAMFKCYCPDVIMLQETLGAGEDIKLAMNKMLPGWTFMTIDAKVISWGLVLGVKEGSLKLLNSWGIEMVLGAEV